MGYIFFTICIGLVCFYIGRVEFLAEKLHDAEKMGRMAQMARMGQNPNQPQQIAIPGYRNGPQNRQMNNFNGQQIPLQRPNQQMPAQFEPKATERLNRPDSGIAFRLGFGLVKF
jgi:hypothetical protein